MRASRAEISSIIVPTPHEGLTVAPKYSKVGWHASDTRELSFSDCRVPARTPPGRARAAATPTSCPSSTRAASRSPRWPPVSPRRCLDESLKYAKERTAFGAPIGKNQAIAFKIADMEVRTHTARLAWYRAAERMMRGEPFKKEAAIAKLHTSEIAVTNAREATQIHGGYGFMNEYPVARHWRDSKILEIGEGTSEVQRMLIARELGL